MTAPNATNEDTLTDRLERQLATLERLDALATRQEWLIDEGDADDILALLAERQMLVSDLVELGGRIEADVEALMPGERTDRVADLLDQIAGRAERIAARDEEHRRRLEARRDELATEMAAVGRGRKALAAYGAGNGRPSARFQDREV